MQKLLLPLILSCILCLPVSGFLYGFVKCPDCSFSLGGILGRFFIGAVHAVLAVLQMGVIWDNEGGTSSTNIWPLTIGVFVVLFIVIFWRMNRNSLKR
ncbi:hypothetical protein KJS94_06105 [Flavihumibacter rivuli]|uniref:hypothetical protein n=1 Tax=Flavihumibacter rivuli TaxID=2838156 RepID=UPI001BDEA32A|nr:hypothetical protein [Flavihumibacter rivuli]ULQ57769.1 hypothetical protein KJS94_06105 [Flavihumibacter rivuli]